ncbi:MAG: sulfite reductase flavoprotein subunit alpha [Porticoccaceae bacterium]|nr:sulfite reductase flavoprotein subunit alpha [Porticoccaceae bacterium]
MTAEVPTRLFSEQQWRQLFPLLNSLDQSQRLWLSGYLAAPEWGAATATTVVADTAERVTIAYGTETDNCKRLAHQLEARCREAGIAAEVVDLAQTRVRRLTKMKYLVVITATHGDGDPPEPITDFYENLNADDMSPLKGLRFAVLALGDSTYENYCVTGQIIDQRLEALGGERLIPRRDCDVDFAQPADEWMTQLLPTLPRAAAATPAVDHSAAYSSAPAAASYSKDSPLEVEVLANHSLSHPDRSHPIHHLELELPVADFPLLPGDAVGVLPENPPQLVASILDATGLSGEAPVVVDDQAMSLVEALRIHRDLTIPSRGFLSAWAALSDAQWLQDINAGEAKAQREFLRQHQVCDLVRRAPARPEPQALVDALRPQQPRLYDLANCLEVNEDELHLTVKAFSYPFGEREEIGIATTFLLDLQPGDSLRIYPHRNARFQLPENTELPLILVAEGTGIAPYRAFLQALAQRATPPPCWLVFAEQQFEEDFLYQTDLQKALADKVLTSLDSVFYSDEPRRQLADPLLDNAERLNDWLAQGAHIYLCGEKDSLDVCEARLQEQLDKNHSEGFWKQLSKDKRVHRNLY